MPAKRRIDTFDPNKSDSADTDFDPTEVRASAKKSRKSSKRASAGPKKRNKRTKYKGSDVSDDDVSDSLLEDSFGDPSESEEEEVEMNEATGRAVRKATKKVQTYVETSDDEIEEEPVVGGVEVDSDDAPIQRGKNKRSRAAVSEEPDSEEEEEDTSRRKKSRLVVLKFNTQPSTGRALRTRKGSTEPLSAGLSMTTRRNTRARTEEWEQPIALSDSGHHIIREGHSPVPIGGRRATKGGKGLKQPASTIKEEIQESSFNEQGVEEPAKVMEIAGSDDQDEADVAIDGTEDKAQDANESTDELAKPGEEEAPAPTADDDDDDEEPVSRTNRIRGSRAGIAAEKEVEEAHDTTMQPTGRRLTRGSKSKQKSGIDASSDFDPGEDNPSDEEMSEGSGKKVGAKDDEYESSPVRRGRRAVQAKSKSTSRRRASPGSEADELLDKDEMAEELEELRPSRRRRARDDSQIAYENRPGRQRKPVDYSIKPMDQIYAQDEDGEDAAPTPTRRARGGRNGANNAWVRNLHSTFGPFGGGVGPAPAIGGPWGTGATGGVDSDSSDDENMQRPSHIGGNVGMTPTSAVAPGLLAPMGQTNNSEALAGLTPAPNVGKIKSQKALADADPLGVDQNVDFSKIGGLENHINQLKEMVQMPLLYPELFMKFHVVPPRGVLFHGPPGTGKTLLARALAASVGSGGRKITFYMRKGADALSKWVGEAERQLRLLFEEARKTQPSIIFFDEIDGLAPVRSSKQEQIHASIVSTLLALMDGMDGRGQVIVIGATNRPDNIDPALRRPGRFDREFYFPLPDLKGRKSIIDINTKDWGIDEAFKNSLAHVTKGYGGADLRALCTEAALNSIQRTYPQIYSSNEKLIVDSDKIKVTAKDFMLSVKKMIPSSERSTSSGAAPLPKAVEPLLRDQLSKIEQILDGLIPIKKKTTALEEAMYEQYDDEDQGFGRETLQQEFEKSRVFRPRLLVCGEPGMGQAYLGGAILNHFEGLHVQSFDLPTIFSDPARPAEAAIVQLFAEVKRHKPSVIYLPGIETWYHILSDSAITTFLGLLEALPPTDPVLVLGITNMPPNEVSQDMLRNLFGFSRKNRFTIGRPSQEHRQEFFSTIVEYVKKSPKDFPEPLNRKKRKLEVLEVAPPPPPKVLTKEEIAAQAKRDRQVLNMLKIQIQPVMDQIHRRYKKFRAPAIPQQNFQYLLDEVDPEFVRPDIAQFRPYEYGEDKDGVRGLVETATGKFFYNLDTTTIEERLSNGFYCRPVDFSNDIYTLVKDAKKLGDKERLLRAQEMFTNVEVDTAGYEQQPQFADCENIYRRQLQRTKEKEEKQKKRQSEAAITFDPIVRSDIVSNGHGIDSHASGSLILGNITPGRRPNAHIASCLSNGFSASDAHASNGTTVPSRAGEDTPMGGTDEQSVSQGMQPPHHPSILSGQSGTRPNTQPSQKSFFQEVSHDTPIKDLTNYASTTTSGKKTSDGWSTQATNGISNLNSSSPVERAGDSQLPDTQRNTQNTQNTQNDTSSEEWMHSQAHALARGTLGQTQTSHTPSSGSQNSLVPAVPPFNAGPRMPSSKSHPSFANLLNDSPVEPTSSQASSQKDLILDDFFADDLLKRLVGRSSGCSIEQLEQINRELMETLWKMRGEYNRNVVAAALINVFNETITDIEEMQKVLNPSQDLNSQRE